MAQYSSGDFGDFRIPPGLGKKIAAIGVLIACLIVVAGSTGIVGAGQRGVLLRFGALTEEIKDEGLYFKVPFAEDDSSDVNPASEIHGWRVGSSSKDLQQVTTEVTLNYQLDAERVGDNLSSNMRQEL